jgi:integrase/recombinase XerD
MATTIAEQREAFLLDMQRVARLRPHTLRAYRYELNAAALGLPVALDTLSLTDVEQWVTRGEVAASTVSRRLATLSRFFTWAVRHHYCTTNPLIGREPTAMRRRLPRPIHTGDDRRAIDAAIASAPQPYRLLFVLLRETGMRAGEALALTIGDVMLAPGREGVRVRDPKNKTERIVILGATATPKSLRLLRAHLKTVQDQPPHAPLVRSPRGTKVTYDTLHYQWAKVCTTAGLVDEGGKPRYTLHQLRHTHGSELIEQGQHKDIVQRVLGHRDPRSTDGYAELHDDQVRAALEEGW